MDPMRLTLRKSAVILLCLFGAIALFRNLSSYARIPRTPSFHENIRNLELKVDIRRDLPGEIDSGKAIYSEETNNKEWIQVTTDEAEMAMTKRRETITQRCPKEKLDVAWNMDVRRHTLYNYQYMFSVCYVPKVGCTFWKSVIHLLEEPNITPEEFTNRLLHQRKEKIHVIKLPVLRHLPVLDLMAFERKSKAIVFGRNPYSRLFSAYIDKFVLSSFWKLIGTVIVKKFRPGATEMSLNCGHDVTFEEFLRYVIDAETTGEFINTGLDDHWTPVTSICSVCEMSYDFIGKLESFTRDNDYIFKELGLDKLLTTRISREDTSKDSMNQTIWTEWISLNRAKCAPFDDVFHRLWLSFQLQGYIPLFVSVPFDRGVRSGMSKSKLEEIVMQVFDESGTPNEELDSQRHQILIGAYGNVGLDVKRGIQRVFKYDFELFDYDIEPVELYRPIM